MGYQRAALKGFSWTGLLRFSIRDMNFLRTVILARLLTPTQFGMFGIAALVLGFIEMLTETGINIILIQEADEAAIKRYLNTAWVTSIFRGLAIAVILAGLSPWLVNFFHQPASLPLFYLIALVPLIRGFINPAIVLFQKRLRFDQEFLFRGTLTLIDAIVTISLALVTHSPASLIWGMLVAAVVEVGISFTFIHPVPRWAMQFDQLKTIVKRGIWVTFTGAVNYLFYNGPDLTIGRLLDSQSLGIYQMAYRLGFVPTTEVGEITNRVTFPIYVAIGGDPARTRKAYLKNNSLVLLVIAPITLLFILFPQTITSIVLGPQWTEVATILPLMGVAVFVSSLLSPASSLLFARKRQERVFIFTLIRTLALLLIIIPLINRYGIMGGPIALLVSALVSLPYTLYAVFAELR